jgi:hypothetical protein
MKRTIVVIDSSQVEGSAYALIDGDVDTGCIIQSLVHGDLWRVDGSLFIRPKYKGLIYGITPLGEYRDISENEVFEIQDD